MIIEIINKIENELREVFEQINNWFTANENQLNFQPYNNGWSIKKVLEHITITNHFLLILIKKGTLKALAKADHVDYSDLLNNYDLDWNKLRAVGEHGSFYWNRPDHMEPTGLLDINEIQNKLQQQLSECLDCLDQLKNGEGILYKTTMSVNDLGKIDVYHYILFLAQHAKRHIMQMEKTKNEFRET
jgi:hypothetical protein